MQQLLSGAGSPDKVVGFLQVSVLAELRDCIFREAKYDTEAQKLYLDF